MSAEAWAELDRLNVNLHGDKLSRIRLPAALSPSFCKSAQPDAMTQRFIARLQGLEALRSVVLMVPANMEAELDADWFKRAGSPNIALVLERERAFAPAATSAAVSRPERPTWTSPRDFGAFQGVAAQDRQPHWHVPSPATTSPAAHGREDRALRLNAQEAGAYLRDAEEYYHDRLSVPHAPAVAAAGDSSVSRIEIALPRDQGCAYDLRGFHAMASIERCVVVTLPMQKGTWTIHVDRGVRVVCDHRLVGQVVMAYGWQGESAEAIRLPDARGRYPRKHWIGPHASSS